MPVEGLQLKTALSRDNKSPSFYQYPLNARQINWVNAHQRKELFSNSSFELKQTLRGHDGIIMSMYTHTFGALQTLYTGSWDKTVIAWNASSGEALCRYIGHEGYVSSIIVDDHNEILYTASSDKTCRAWNVKTGQMLCVFRGHNSHVQSIQLIHRTPDGNLKPKHEETQDMEEDEDEERRDDEKKVTFYKASFFAKEERKKKLFDVLISGSADCTVRFWNILNGDCFQIFHCGESVRVLQVQDNFLFAIASRKLSVFNLDVDELTDIASVHRNLTAHRDLIWDLKLISLNGAYYALTASFDRSIILWDVDTGKEIMTMLGHTNQVYCLDYDEEAKVIYSGSADTTALSWDLTTGKKLMRFAGHLGSVECVQIICGLLYTASSDTTIRVWKKESGKCLSVYRGHGDCILHMKSFIDYSRRHATTVNSASSFFEEGGPPVEGVSMIISAAMENEIMVWKSFKYKPPSKLTSWNIFAKEKEPLVEVLPAQPPKIQPEVRIGRSDSRGHKRSFSDEDVAPSRRITGSKSSPSVIAAVFEDEKSSKKNQGLQGTPEKTNGLTRSPSNGSPSSTSSAPPSSVRSNRSDEFKEESSIPGIAPAQNDKMTRMTKRMNRLIHHQQLQQFRHQVNASQQLFASNQYQQKQQRTLRTLETKLTGQGSIHTTDLLNILDTLEQSIQQEQERLQKLKQIILESQTEQKKMNIDAKVYPTQPAVPTVTPTISTSNGTTTPTSKPGHTRIQKVSSKDSLHSVGSVSSATESPAVFLPPSLTKVNSNLTLTPVASSHTLSDLIPLTSLAPSPTVPPSLAASSASVPSVKSSRRTSMEKISELEALEKELARLSVNSASDYEFDTTLVSSKLNIPAKDRKSLQLPRVTFEELSTTGLDSRDSRSSSRTRIGQVPKSRSLPELHNSHPKDIDLIIAIQDNDVEEVQNLINNHQLDVNTIDDNLMTPLIWAARTNNTSCARLLLASPKLDVNAQDALGWSALHYAANCGHTDVLTLLLRHPEINIRVKNLQKQRPVHVTHRKEIINLLHVASKKNKMKAQPPNSLRVTSNPIFGKPLVATSSILKALKDEHLTFNDLKKQIQQLEAVNDALEREIKLESMVVPEV